MSVRGKLLRISGYLLLWLTAFALLLFGSVWLILKVPAVQNFVVSKAVHYVSNKTHTRVTL